MKKINTRSALCGRCVAVCASFGTIMHADFEEMILVAAALTVAHVFRAIFDFQTV